MTVHFNKGRARWIFDFVKGGKRYQGNCLDATGQPVTSKSAARQAEGVEKRRVEMEPKIAKPGELTLAMAIAGLAQTWSAQASWPARQIWLRDIIDFFGLDSAIASIDQAKVDDYVTRCRAGTISRWNGGPDRDPLDSKNARYWFDSGKTRSAATVNLYLGTLRQIFARAGAHRDPQTSQLIFPWLPTVTDIKRQKRKARPMPDQVSTQIMGIMPAHVVDGMMVTALFGFRKTEAFTLQRPHIDWDGEGIRLKAEDVKDLEDRFLPADQFAMGYLRCLDMKAEARGTRDLITFQAGKDLPFLPIKKPRAAWKRARAFMRATYGQTWRWHDLRAAFITSVAMRSGGIVAQDLAGHSDFATTQLYIEVADEMRRIAATRISDRAQILSIESPLQKSLTAEFGPKPGRRKAI